MSKTYENAKVFSLRDRDDKTEEIEDMPPLVRMRLTCRNAENLIVSDEVLETLEMSWPELENNIEEWIREQKGKDHSHPHLGTMDRFRSEGYRRKEFDLKEIRQDLIHLCGSNKPWEVAVGQTISRLKKSPLMAANENSIYNYLGYKINRNVLPD